MKKRIQHLPLFACMILAADAASAATLSTWSATKTITNADTASPTLGDGSNGGAAAIMYASFPTITLTKEGDSITLSGSFTVSGAVTGQEQAIRFGLFDNNASTNVTNWRGYLGTNRTAANNASSIWERANQTSGDFLTTTTAGAFLASTTGSSTGTPPASGTFSFSETITRTATGVSMSFSLSEAGGFLWTATNTDTTPNGGVVPIEYDRVGIGFSGTYSADQAVFSNITVVPEPSAALLGGLGMLALLRRRRS
jgi:hypothetical protein